MSTLSSFASLFREGDPEPDYIGPGKYELKSTIGAEKSFSFGGKNVKRDAIIPLGDNPGPGSYNPSMIDQRPKLKVDSNFGYATRDQNNKVYSGPGSESLSMIEAPGPGNYAVPSTVGNDSPSFSFSSGKRFEEYGKNNNPQSFACPSSIGNQVLSTKPSLNAPIFSKSHRNQLQRQYLGAGLGAIQNGDISHSPGIDRCATVSSIGKQPDRRANSPAFSFAPRPGLSKTVVKSPSKKHMRMSKSASGLRVSLSQNESMPKYPSLGQSRKIQKQDYSWLYSNTSAKIKSKVVGEVYSLPRSKEYNSSGTASFGSEKRFTDNIYTPQLRESGCANVSPGPIYDLPSTMRKTPSATFIKASNRSPHFALAAKEAIPGPGAYNISADLKLAEEREEYERVIRDGSELSMSPPRATRLRQSMSAPSLSRSSFVKSGKSASPTRNKQNSQKSSATNQNANDARFENSDATKKEETQMIQNEAIFDLKPVKLELKPVPSTSKISSMMSAFSTTSRKSHDHSSSLRFGTDCRVPTSPSHSFGSGNRDTYKHIYQPGALNPTISGRESPGPAYELKNTIGNESPSYSFGGQNIKRNSPPKQSSDIGPAAYEIRPVEFGKECRSTSQSSPQFSFGTGNRSSFLPSSDSPGPDYEIHDSFVRPSSPNTKFGPNQALNKEH